MGWLDAYDRHAGNAASGNQLGFELGAVGAAASAGLGVLVVGVHVSTVCYVDTMLLHPRRQCQMGWPDAYVRHWFGRKKTARRRRFVVVSAFLQASV